MEDGYAAIRQLFAAVDLSGGSYAAIARQLGITENALALFYALDDGGDHAQVDICREWMIPKTTLNTIVREYVEKGLLVYAEKPRSREKYLRLTESGRQYATQILRPVYAAELRAYRRTCRDFSPAFVDAFRLFAEQIRLEMQRPLDSSPPPISGKDW